MRLPWLAGCAIIAILPLLWLPALPGPGILAFAGVLALLLTRLRGTVIAVVAMTLLLMVWGVLSAYQALWPTQHLTGAARQAEVFLHETDGQTLHRGQIVRLADRFLFPPVGVTLYGELAPAPVCAGQRWMMTLRLRPVHGQLNDGGFDSQRYALAQHRPLSGGIVAASALDTRCSLRARYLASLTQRLLASGDAGPGDGGAAGAAGGGQSPDAEHRHLPPDGYLRFAYCPCGFPDCAPAARFTVPFPGALDRLAATAAGRAGGRRRLCLADRYAATGPAHLRRACSLLCFTFVGSTLDGVAGVALLSGGDSGC